MPAIRRWAARAALALLVIAALWALWILRVHSDTLWPFFSGHHPRVLVLIVGIVTWVITGGVAIAAVIAGLMWLGKEATR